MRTTLAKGTTTKLSRSLLYFIVFTNINEINIMFIRILENKYIKLLRILKYHVS